MIDDAAAWPHLAGLRDAVLDEVATRGLAGFCDSYLAAGQQFALDNCNGDCEGVLWTRTAGAFPSVDFPNPQSAVSRGPIILAEQFEVGIVRGMSVPSKGQAYESDDFTRYTQRQHADMAAILNAICGYFRGLDISFIIGNYTPYGPQGACVGGSWLVTARTGA